MDDVDHLLEVALRAQPAIAVRGPDRPGHVRVDPVGEQLRQLVGQAVREVCRQLGWDRQQADDQLPGGTATSAPSGYGVSRTLTAPSYFFWKIS